jgi:Domain of Unknown Function with PDB structure (DUF3857)/Transglutaminase-like superfamily
MVWRVLRNGCSWLVLGLSCLLATAQDQATAPLPDSLTRGAGMIKRVDVTEIDIESPRKARIHRRYVYTILNPHGDFFSNISTFYDKYHDLKSVTAVLYDARGREVKRIKKSDLQDNNIEGMGILMMDLRVKTYQFGYHEYPYTISYEEEMDLDGLFGLQPQWAPQPENFVSVVSSSLVIHAPADFPLEFRQYRLPGPGITQEKRDRKTYTWQLTSRPVSEREPYAPGWFEREPRISLAPGAFELEGSRGSCYSWTDLGKFVGGLQQGRGQLPEEARRKVHALVDGTPDDHEKIRVLYRFLQQNTHYVGIELGIGGWQPYDAAYVYSKKYGDCKALSNYMVALLKEAGIRAYSVLIRGGINQPSVDTGFACIQFNHEIAVAFTGQDTVWLECTSSTLPAGYLGSFTADREGLLLDENGGHLIHTPVYGIRENRLLRMVKGSVDGQGNLLASIQTTYTGLDQDYIQSTINNYTRKELLQKRRDAIGLNNCELTDLRDSTWQGTVPTVEETVQLTADQFATVIDNRLLLSYGVFMKRLPRLGEGASRKNGFELQLSQEENDSLVLRLPAGWVPEEKLPAASFSAGFGAFRFSGRFEDGVLTLVSDFRQYKGSYPVTDYDRLVRFFDLVYREASRQLVFIKAPSKTGL